MADVHKNIILSFQVDNSGLQGTIDKLEEAGAVTKTTAQAIRDGLGTGIQQGGAKAEKTIEDLKKGLQDLNKVSSQNVQLGIADALDEAGVSAEEFEKALKDAGKATEDVGKKSQSSKQQLKAMREELIQLSLQGKQNTDRFRQLSAEAGHLEDTIGDVTKTVKHLGSDTHVFDGLIGAATGIAGAFSVAQGAAGLFGSENEELQQALLKVNSAMAILQGLQAIQNTLQKDSAASLLFLREAQTAEVVVTEASTVAKEGNIVVTYLQVAAQKALQVAMALSNPITLAVVAAITLATAAYKLFTADAKKAAEAQDQFNLSAEETNKVADAILEESRKSRDQRAKDLKAQGVNENKIRATTINETIRLLSEAQKNEDALAVEGNKAQARLASQRGADQDAEQVKRDQKTAAAFDQAVKRTEDLNDELHNLQIDDAVALAAEKDKIDKESAEKRKKNAQDAEDAIRRGLTETIAVLKLASAEAQQREDPFGFFRSNKQLILAQAKLDKFEISIKQAHGEITKVQADAEKGLVDLNATIDINKLRKTLIQTNNVTDEELEKGRKKQIDDMQQTNLKVLDGHIATNAAIVDDDKKRAAAQAAVDEAAQKKRRQDLAKVTGIIAGELGQAAQTIGTFFDQQAQQQLDGIQRQKDAVDELRAAGEITEKEAIIRNRRLDQQAKKIQTEQAKRQKAIAIFEAIVNGAAAVTKALAEGGPLLAIAVGVIAAAQVALIASKPIPKFKAGKPIGGYEGPALIGEAGPEFHESGGRMMLATEPTVTYLRRNDRVFNARETAQLMNAAPQMSRQYQVYTGHAPNGAGLEAIDYKRFGSEVGAHVHNTAVNLTEKGLYTLSKKNGDFYKYLNARRGL